MTDQYLIVVRDSKVIDSEWIHVDFAIRRAKELRGDGINCDIYSKVIE